MCDHTMFYIHGKVARLTDSDESEVVTGYRADITIKCVQCQMPFEFVGLPAGFHHAEPTTSFDARELRCPIKPTE